MSRRAAERVGSPGRPSATPSLFLGLTLFAAGCSREAPAETPAEPAGSAVATATEAPAPPAPHTGVVHGVVKLAEGAALPAYTAAEQGRSGQEPLAFPAGSPPHTEADDQPVHLGEGRGLEGVLVSATGDPSTFFRDLPEHRPEQRRLSIEDGRLSPKLVVALRGDTLVLQNSTRENAFPVVGQNTFAESLVFGESRSVPLDRAGFTAITCPVLPHCGRADLVVIMNPVFTVTGDDGRFELHDVPAGQDVRIHAWHPLFQEARVDTKVDENGERTVELVLTPLPRDAAAPSPSP
jgi:hypothetical protein